VRNVSDIGECRGHRWENGQWILCGYGDTRDEGRVTLPEEARKRITEERPGEFAAEGYRTASKFGIERTGVSFSKVNP
jgi:hypothetical protein